MKPKPAERDMTRSILAFVIMALVVSYFLFAVPDCFRNRAVCFGSADLAPVRYRVLQPALEHLLSANGSQEAIALADFGIQAALTIIIVLGLNSWLRRWMTAEQALVGVLVFAVMYIASFHFYMRAISTSLELALVLGGLWCLPRSLRLPSLPA